MLPDPAQIYNLHPSANGQNFIIIRLNQNRGSHINWREDEAYDRDDGWHREHDGHGANENEAYDNFYDGVYDERDIHDRDGYGRDGYDGEGYDGYGYNRDGYDRYGYDREGYDRDGYPGEEYGTWEDRVEEGDPEESHT